MLQRFASASLVACIAVAVAATSVSLTLPAPPEKLFRLLSIWCVLPALWGVWAMLAPTAWTPRFWPLWGALLGFIAGMFCEFVLKLPKQVFGVEFTAVESLLGILILAGFYAVLWLAVRAVYLSFSHGAAERVIAARAH